MHTSLDKKYKKQLKALCHNLKPTIIVGTNGVNKALMQELILTLNHHELIKIKINLDAREQRALAIEEILTQSGAQKIQQIGKMLCIFKKRQLEPKQGD